MNILDLKMQKNDSGAKTVRGYLQMLLLVLWQEDEGFSGKRPFGNSGWKNEIYYTLVKHKVVKGSIDGKYLGEVDEQSADELIEQAILSL